VLCQTDARMIAFEVQLAHRLSKRTRPEALATSVPVSRAYGW
jgi:hypothetical protein